jgi:hypothetical protein
VKLFSSVKQISGEISVAKNNAKKETTVFEALLVQSD